MLPLSVKTQYITVDINNQVATVKVEQTFYNSTDRDLEGIYYFPLPEGGNIVSFARWDTDHWIEAKVKEKEHAEEIYKAADPQTTNLGLVEYEGKNSFKTQVNPIRAKSETAIKFIYNQILKYEDGQCYFNYPLSAKELKDNLKDLSIKVNINSQMPVTKISCTSHKGLSVRKINIYNYEIIYEKRETLPDRDFFLSYEVSPGDIGINLLTYRKDKDPGYFMLLLTPVLEADTGKIANRDIIFVIDHSGSMSDANKMVQARSAFKYCLKLLNKEDNFNIVIFDDRIKAYKEELISASQENIKKASDFIDYTYPDGSTNIYMSLIEALKLFHNNKRPKVIVLLTDGMHNVGAFDYDEIIKANKYGCRIFTFGVGSVDNTLMEKVAKMNRGNFIEIKDTAKLEDTLSNFYKKISRPTLTDLKLEFKGISPVMSYPDPGNMPDLFMGSQVVLIGQYEQSGKGEIILKGYLNQREKRFSCRAEFPEITDEKTGSIPGLWAGRRIDYLLSEITQEGEKSEWKNEIISLGQKFNLVTPYTSMLLADQGVAKDDNSSVSHNSRRDKNKQSQIIGKPSDGGYYSTSQALNCEIDNKTNSSSMPQYAPGQGLILDVGGRNYPVKQNFSNKKSFSTGFSDTESRGGHSETLFDDTEPQRGHSVTVFSHSRAKYLIPLFLVFGSIILYRFRKRKKNS
jgi:Ca-activated chloride channel family protein